MTDNKRTLKYVITDEKGTPSLNIDESDDIINNTHMDQVVGTLIKYSGTGHYEPFLATHWVASSDQLKWTFELRPNISFEDGTPITSINYIAGLKKAFRLYLKHSSPPSFEYLEGWDRFVKGDESSLGIKAIHENKIEFRFKKRPDGLLEFLAMPYFGAHHLNDFSGDQWKDPTKITASGAYKVSSLGKNSKLVLEKRPGFFSLKQNSPDQVEILYKHFTEASQLYPQNTIIYKKLDGTEKIPFGYRRILGTPNILIAIDLNQEKKESPFLDKGIRKWFQNSIRKAQEKVKIKSDNAILTQTFYASPDQHISSRIDNAVDFKKLKNKNIKILTTGSLIPSEQEYAENLIRDVLSETPVNIEWTKENRSENNWVEKYFLNTDYDIRIKRVNIGSQLIEAAARMMFCSKLGVAFPDPSNRIYELMNDFSKCTSSNALVEYTQKFEDIILDESSVIPLFHSSLTWLFSEDINIDQVTPTMSVPRFDLIQLKDE